AEHTIRDDHAAAGGAAVPAKKLVQLIGVAIAIDVSLSPGKATTIDQARMVQLIAENGIFPAGKRCQHRQIGRESAAEEEGLFGPFPTRQGSFQGSMRRLITRDQR